MPQLIAWPGYFVSPIITDTRTARARWMPSCDWYLWWETNSRLGVVSGIQHPNVAGAVAKDRRFRVRCPEPARSGLQSYTQV
jgi:hypothetical protein